jgi:hypothetical protein
MWRLYRLFEFAVIRHAAMLVLTQKIENKQVIAL